MPISTSWSRSADDANAVTTVTREPVSIDSNDRTVSLPGIDSSTSPSSVAKRSRKTIRRGASTSLICHSDRKCSFCGEVIR
ncbi:Uncharacterised protein [Mycobacteroides abscessus subsp. abscessus]|nr:Uncharacterised protein [Mycobacteroides abscessus subsp. abscessus]